MSTAVFPPHPQSTPVGVTTRSRKRIRDAAVPSPPAADPRDRKKSKPEPASLALRRSTRHAAMAVSREKRDISPTPQARHSDPKTPSTSRSTSLVDEDSEPKPDLVSPQLLSREEAITTTQDDDMCISAGTQSSNASAFISSKTDHAAVEIIDLTDPPSGQKRRLSMLISEDVDDDDDEQKSTDEPLRRMTRSCTKKAKMEDTTQIEGVGNVSTRRARVPRPGPPRRRNSSSTAQSPALAKVVPALHTATLDLLKTHVDNEVSALDQDQDTSREDSFQCVPHVQPLPDAFTPTDVSCSSTDDVPPVEELTAVPVEAVFPPWDIEEQPRSDSSSGPACPGEPVVDIAPEPSVQAPSGSTTTDYEVTVSVPEEPVGVDLVADSISDVTSSCHLEVAGAPQSNELPGDDGFSPSVYQTERDVAPQDTSGSTPVSVADDDTGLPPMSLASNLDMACTSMPDRPNSPESPSLAYFGVDVRFLRFRNPPTSNLAPNPVRRAPRSPTVRRDKFRYLLDATEKAGLLAFAQTRRQFPRWMQRPSRNYFVGSKFIPRGEPVPAEHLEPEEVCVGMDIDGALASSAARDIFLLPQTDLYPSESSCMTSQMELDPDLDPSSLLNGQSVFYSQGATADFLGSGQSSAVHMPTSYSTPAQSACGRFWSPQALSTPSHDGFASMQGQLSGTSSGGPFHANNGSLPSGSARPYANELPWDPTHWVNSPQFALFGVPPLPLPVQNMSMDSSLSAMSSYFGNDSHRSFDPDVIDGIPSALATQSPTTPTQFQQCAPDSYQSSPSN